MFDPLVLVYIKRIRRLCTTNPHMGGYRKKLSPLFTWLLCLEYCVKVLLERALFGKLEFWIHFVAVEWSDDEVMTTAT